VPLFGAHHGYFDKTPGSAENEAVIEKINAVKPNILIVGFGMPLQDRWLMENWLRRVDAASTPTWPSPAAPSSITSPANSSVRLAG